MNISSVCRRIAALWFPFLSTDRLKRQRKEGSLKEPLVVAGKEKGALKLVAVDPEAARLGLRAGMTLADARAMLPALAVATEDAGADLRLLTRLAEWCDRFTPFVALDAPQTLLLDVTGASHLFGGERALLDGLRRTLTGQGFVVRAALAGTAAAARALAREKDGVIVEPGADCAALAPLPVEALAFDAAVVHGLRRAGLKTVGQVAARRRVELVARFGKAVADHLDQALGKGEKPISPRLPLPDYMSEHRFADPVTSEEALADTLALLARSLARLLEERGEGARALEAAFFRADGKVYRLGIATGRPTRDPDIVLRLFREKLAALADPLDPGFGFDLVRLCVPRAEKARPEAVAFDGNRKDEDEIAFLADRLATRFGPTRLLCFRPNDTHIPEAAAPAVPAQGAEPSPSAWERIREAGEAPRRPVRLFTRPEPVEALAEIPDGPPLRFRWRRVLHEVAFAEGPERIAMEWWRHQEQPPSRDYFRVEDKDGRRFWLYRAGLWGRETASPKWFVHGVFA